jgi:hypothetical protein
MMAAMPAIPPNSSAVLPLSGTTDAQRPSLGGEVLYDEVVSHIFSDGTGSVPANVQFRVVRSTATGLLDFYYRIIATHTFASPLSFVVEVGFPGLVFTYADFRPDGLGTLHPTSFQIFPHDEPTEQVYKFVFNQGMTAGESTRFFFISSNAKQFTPVASEISSATATNPCPGPTAL